MGRSSELSVLNKLRLYNQILLNLFGLTDVQKKTNMQIIQTFQNKVLRNIVNAPWYIRNKNFHRDLKIEMVSEEVKRCASKHTHRLQIHQNSEIEVVLYVAQEDKPSGIDFVEV